MTAESQGSQPEDPPPNAEPATMHLGASCTIREAEQLKTQLLGHLDAAKPLLIDGSAVERADTSVVQVLVAFALDCMERGMSFGWTGRSSTLNRAIALLGVSPLLESPGSVMLPKAVPAGSGSQE